MQIIFLGEGCVPYNLLLAIDWLVEHVFSEWSPCSVFQLDKKSLIYCSEVSLCKLLNSQANDLQLCFIKFGPNGLKLVW